MNSRAGQQGKALTAAQKLENYTKLNNKLKLKSGIISAIKQTVNSQKNPSS